MVLILHTIYFWAYIASSTKVIPLEFISMSEFPLDFKTRLRCPLL